MILEAQKIVKKIDNKIILDCIDLSINEGQVVSIQGASGSGKTTLLNILGLLDNPSNGRIKYYNSLEYDNFNSSDRVNTIGYIFQFHHLLSEFKVIDNLIIPQLLAGKEYKESNTHAEELLSMLDLNYLKDRCPHEISGGECQRIAVLRGIVNRPKIVFADEPTGNLDRKNSAIIIKLLNDLKDTFRISFLIATHDNYITKISDKSFYIENGKLKE